MSLSDEFEFSQVHKNTLDRSRVFVGRDFDIDTPRARGVFGGSKGKNGGKFLGLDVPIVIRKY